jgi:CRAL/TRIO domain
MERIHHTIQWRKTKKLDQVRDDISSLIFHHDDDDEIKKKQRYEALRQEFETGYFYVRGYDHQGRAIINIHPTATKTGHYDTMIQCLLYQLEKAIACTKRKSSALKVTPQQQPLEKFIFIGDYTTFGSQHRTPITILNEVFTLFNTHYPERLYCAYIVNPPFLISTILSLIKPFLDPITRTKIQLCHLKYNKKKNIYEPDSILQTFLSTLEKPIEFETCYTGRTDVDIRSYDVKEYLQLPFDMAYDEK